MFFKCAFYKWGASISGVCLGLQTHRVARCLVAGEFDSSALSPSLHLILIKNKLKILMQPLSFFGAGVMDFYLIWV